MFAQEPSVCAINVRFDGLVTSGLATREELDRLIAEVAAFTERDDTAVSFPRIFQASGRKS